MSAIKATWKNGQILPDEPVDWVEGSELLVEPVSQSDRIGLIESEWRDDPESIAKWIAIVEKIEPLVWADGELEKYERYRQASRAFNIEAVRQQMEDIRDGDST